MIHYLTNITRSTGPDCEDDETQAETRRIHARSVAVESKKLTEAAISTWSVIRKVVSIDMSCLASRLIRPFP